MNQRDGDIDAAIDAAVEQAFEETFEQKLFDYWTLILPARPCPTKGCMSEWYARDLKLARGRFMSEHKAHIWAFQNLYGPYSVKFLEFPYGPGDEPIEIEHSRFDDSTWASIPAASVDPEGWPTDRDCLRHDTAYSVQGESYDRFHGDEREWDDPNMGGQERDPREEY
jgi:hypothetical protein